MDKSTEDLRENVAEHVDEIRQEVTQKVSELREAVTSFVNEKPLQSVGIAFGVGYILSGALVSRTTARLASLGMRIAFGGALKSMLAEAGPGLLNAVLSNEGQKQHGNRSSNRSQR